MNQMKESCPNLETLAGWLEGGLSPAQRAGVTSHLAACDDCRRAVEIASGVEPPAQERPVDEILLARVVTASRRKPLWRYAAAAGILLAVGVTFILFRPAPPAPLESVVTTVPDRKPVGPPVVAVDPKPDPVKPVAVEPKPVEVKPDPPKPVVDVPRPVEPPPVAPEVKPPPRRDPLPTQPAPAKVFAKVFVIEPVGDLWLEREKSQASRPATVEHVSSVDKLTARSAPAAFTLEARASVILEKGAEAGVGYSKPDDSYRLSVAQGLVMLDTEGTVQKWQIASGGVELSFQNLNGQIAVEPRGDDRLAVVLLEGKGEVRVGDSVRKAEVGKEVLLTRDGALSEQKVETQKKLARLTELRPKTSTAFAATFDERKTEAMPYPYGIEAGKLTAGGPSGSYVQAEGPKPGDAPLLTAALKMERPLFTTSRMVIRFRYRTNLPGFTVRLGNYSVDFPVKRQGQWVDGEIPLQAFTFEGVPVIPSDEFGDVRFTAPYEKKSSQLDIDGVQFLRRTR